MKIALIGTRGIPNNYGGFEQLAEYLSVGLSAKGHEISVYNAHDHPHQDETWNNIHIIHCYDPEKKLGTAGQFIYDLNCILDARKRNFDVILALGYTSFSIWGPLFPKRTALLINMDGLEWKRTKYSRPVQKFLRYAERLAVKYCDFFIADSTAIRDYLKNKYGIDSEYIAYGAELHNDEDESLLTTFGLAPGDYYMLMARMEPENNIEMILEGFNASASTKRMIVVGNAANPFGQHLTRRFAGDPRILFAGPIYNAKTVHSLKAFSSLYFHGHSVGGTNPSLLEAMASRAAIAAHDNPFNKAILGEDAFYFSNAADIRRLIDTAAPSQPGSIQTAPEKSAAENQKMIADQMIADNLHKIIENFSWDKIISQYDAFIRKSFRDFTK